MTTGAAEPSPAPAWAAALLVLGGLAMSALWLVFTASHGPTSFNENRIILGQGMHFWGLLLGVVPNLLVVAGLIGLRAALLARAGAVGRIGFLVAVAGLLGSAALDLWFGALAPPLLLPVVGAGLVALGASGEPRGVSRMASVRRSTFVIGLLLLVGTVMAWMPVEVSDGYEGYRLYGAVAHLASGVGWMVAGASAWAAGRRA
jgi:hypothetical protein